MSKRKAAKEQAPKKAAPEPQKTPKVTKPKAQPEAVAKPKATPKRKPEVTRRDAVHASMHERGGSKYFERIEAEP